MKKRLLSILFTLAVCLGLLSVTALAEDTADYGVSVNGTPVTSANASDVLSNGKVSYNADTNTLTINGTLSVSSGANSITGNGTTDVKIDGGNGPAVIGGLFTVTGAKDVKVTANSYAPAINNGANINCSGDVTITNSGYNDAVSYTLTVTGARNVKVTANSNNAAISTSATIDCSGDVEIANTNQNGWYAVRELTVTRAQNVTVTANNNQKAISKNGDTEVGANITCSGDVNIANNGTGTAVDGTFTFQQSNGHSYTVKTGNDLENLAVYAEKAEGETFHVESLDARAVKIKSDGHNLTKTEAKAATCTEDGNNEYYTCSGCDKVFKDADGMTETTVAAETIAATGHTLTKTEAKDATCTEDGNNEYYTCSGCGKVFKDADGTTETTVAAETIAATGHTPGEWKYDGTQHWRFCTVCKAELDRADHAFSGNTCSVCGYSVANPFVDVTADEFYYDAVQWAVRNGITTGTTDTTFSPNAPCTRAQMVTFLWRAAGCPTPNSSEMPFKDVVKGSFYETAVLWAVENGITNGTSATTFAPDATCSRAQFATLLWRAQRKPSAGTSNPFTDVAEGAYYTEAVLWAAENGITEGTSATTFSPDKDCLRAETVTFLYRCLGK